jgi:hypothetical protein
VLCDLLRHASLDEVARSGEGGVASTITAVSISFAVSTMPALLGDDLVR